MERLFAVLFLIGLVIIGFVRRLVSALKTAKRIETTDHYRSEFIDFINELFEKRLFNNKKYYKLTSTVSEMQAEMGSDGVFAYVQDPLHNMAMRNYPLLVNFLPELRNYLSESYTGSSIVQENYIYKANSCDDMFIRHIGVLEASLKQLRKKLINPIDCFAYGVRTILTTPIYIISSFGLLTASFARKISNSLIVRIIAGVIALIGFAASVVTIIIGWEQFYGIVKSWLY